MGKLNPKTLTLDELVHYGPIECPDDEWVMALVNNLVNEAGGLAVITDERDERDSTIEDLEDTINDLEKNKSNLEDQVDLLEGEKRDLQKKLSEAEDKIEGLYQTHTGGER